MSRPSFHETILSVILLSTTSTESPHRNESAKDLVLLAQVMLGMKKQAKNSVVIYQAKNGAIEL
jgi:hypothetical protein